jgi:hypothetical protein
MEYDKEQYDAWEIDCEHEEQALAEIDAKVQQYNTIWKAKWPDYCRVCDGWGMLGEAPNTPEDPGPEPCDAFGDEDRCHRCGSPLSDLPLNQAMSQWHCSMCGWSWDDGLQK